MKLITSFISLTAVCCTCFGYGPEVKNDVYQVHYRMLNQVLESSQKFVEFSFLKLIVEGFDGFTATPEADSYRNVTELITSKGYGCEQHDIITQDGYILSLQRIIPKQNVPVDRSRVVILQHGLLDSSATWVINQENNSLGFMLADQGFDVWLPNSRGNVYSHSHVQYNTSQREFWEFSWDEMSLIDIPAVVNYVTEVTGVSRVHYVGHSEGTLTGFVAFSQNEELAKKISHFYALAPILTLAHVKGPVKDLAPLHWLYLFKAANGHFEFEPSTPETRETGRVVCSNLALLCEYAISAFCGLDMLGFNSSRADVYFSHMPAGTSLRNVDHWAQLVLSGETQKYNFDRKGNMEHYGQETAPIYNVSNLSVPVSLFSGTHDFLADPEDVELLENTIPSAVVVHKIIDGFNHVDFTWGVNAAREIYDVIIEQMKNNG